MSVLILLSRHTMASVKNLASRALADGPLSHPGVANRAFDWTRAWLEYAAKATIEATASRGVAAEFYPDEVDLSAMGPTLALIGTDRVQPDGSLVNGAPSLDVAKRLAGIAPLYVACETFKLEDDAHVGEGFEIVPAELVAGFITDRGVVLTDQVWGLRQSA